MIRALLLYTPAGGGHRAAANAIAAELRAIPGAEVAVRDVLEFAPSWFAYRRAWTAIQSHGGRAWDWLFDVTERGQLELDPVRLPLHAALFAELDRYLLAYRPTHIVCTHYLPALAVARVKSALGARTMITVTDHLEHRAWVVPGTDLYCVADDQVARRMRTRAPGAEVRATGIPISRAAAMPVRAIGRTGSRVLALLGGVPRADAFAVIDQLAKVAGHERFHILTGDAREIAAYANAKLFGAEIAARTDGLLAAIDAADLVLTKAGGLTVSECLARGRAMVLPFAAPGQERGNLGYALANGAALRPELSEIADVVGALLREPNQLRRMSARARMASHPQAAAEAVACLLATSMEVRDAA